MSGITYLSMLSATCAVGLHELCQGDGCECYFCHDLDVEPLALSPEADDPSILEYDRRAEMRADR